MDSTKFGHKLLFTEPIFWYFVVFIFCVYYIWVRRKIYILSWKIPGPIPLPLLGSTIFILLFGVSNVFPLLKILMRRYKPNNKMIRVWFGEELVVLVSDANIAAQINAATLNKASIYQYLGQPYLEKGIFVDNDIPHWKSSKKVVTQVFHYKVLRSCIKIFHEESIILSKKLEPYAKTEENFFIPKIMQLCTYNSIMRTTLGYNPNAQLNEDQPFIGAIHNMFKHFQTKLFLPFFRVPFIWLYLGWRKEEEKTMQTLLKLPEKILDDFSNGIEKSDDHIGTHNLAELLLQHPNITLEEVKAQIITVIGAGLDTSMVQNSVLLAILGVYPEVQNKVYEEIITSLGEDLNVCPTYDDLMQLEYLDRVIKECLRLYPAAPFTGRKITEEIKINFEGKEYIFPPGVMVAVMIYYIQRSPDYFENPHDFDPDRWLPENIAKRNPYSYVPFSSGPRNCIGGKYALLQMKALTATMLRKYEILPSDTCKGLRDVKVKMNMTMEIHPSCKIRLKERSLYQKKVLN